MKSILMSINPKWCKLIESGRKTIEVRKTKPKCDVPFKVYIYCTKDKHDSFICRGSDDLPFDVGNGMVIGEFVCDKIITVDCDSIAPFDRETKEYIDKETCLDRNEIWYYLNAHIGYGWHISDLVIYDEPKELNEFLRPCDFAADCGFCKHAKFYGDSFFDCGLRLIRPPQSWCYVER